MNDIRVTQYALGELSEAERKAFERDLAASEILQRELLETIHIAELLGKNTMTIETLTPDQRTQLRRGCASNLEARRRKARIMRIALWGGSAAAACLLIVLWSSGVMDGPPAARAAAAPAPPESVMQATVNSPSTPASPDMPAIASMTPAAASEEIPVIADASKTLAEAASASLEFKVEGGSRSQATSHPMQVAKAKENGSQTAAAAPLAKPATSSGGLGIGRTSEAQAPAAAALPAEAGFYAGLGDKDRRRELNDNLQRQEPSRLDPSRGFNTEAYDAIQENEFMSALDNPLSTFSIDVDTASYANVRRFLQSEQLPPAGAIRTEELINYFSYGYPAPQNEVPFSVTLEASQAPWDLRRQLVRIGLKGREISSAERPPANLIFLVDVSGSMNTPEKLPLLKRSLKSLVENLSVTDRVAIVVYAGSSGLALPSTAGSEKPRIMEALENLEAGGSTNGASGIQLAYQTAREHFLKNGNNRVILCTDGDFNVGTTSQSELVRLIEKERASGVFLSVLGFGTGNLKDSTMEKLADKGNGNYAYIDSLTEGRKVLVEQMGGTLFTIAKDVKIQVEFNPARVTGYRLIGYENRLLAKEDFNDDRKDAGEIGAGHTVTALYEVIPAGQPLPDQRSVDALKYRKPELAAEREVASNEMLTVKLRYKEPGGETSKLLTFPLAASGSPAFEKASPDFQFAAAVAAFSMKLRGSPTAGKIGWPDIQNIVRVNLGQDPGSYRAEFLTLIEKAARLKPSQVGP